MQSKHARAPKQARSRESFDRVLDAAERLLEGEGGLQALTLAEVSRLSKVSIGSIYARVKGKEDLLRAVQTRVLREMDLEFSSVVNGLRRHALPLRDLVPALVRELADFLQRHGSILNAFIQQGVQDALVATVGRKSHSQLALDFKLLLLERQGEFQHPDPDHAASTCFTVVYGCLARYLGLGASREAGAGEGDWQQLVEDLGLMALAFLAMDLRQQVTKTIKPARPVRGSGSTSR